MVNIDLSLLLHGYQPPTQPYHIVKKIIEEAYVPTIELFASDDCNGEISMNLSAEMIERLCEANNSVVSKIKRAVKRKKVELTGSSYCHWILPLVKKEEGKKQIELGVKLLERVFDTEIDGVFPPEMCCSKETVEGIQELQFKWCVLDEILAILSGESHKSVGTNFYEFTDFNGLMVSLRRRDVSRILTSVSEKYKGINDSERLYEVLEEVVVPSEDVVICAADDLEHFGHHHKGRYSILKKILESRKIKLVCIGKSIKNNNVKSKKIHCESCSWASRLEELDKGIPYALWYDKNNDIHRLQWSVADILLKAHGQISIDDEHLLKLIGKALHSCQFWWASCRPNWNVYYIEKGAKMIEETAKIIYGTGLIEKGDYTEAKKIVDNIVMTAQKWENEGISKKKISDFKKLIGEGPLYTFYG